MTSVAQVSQSNLFESLTHSQSPRRKPNTHIYPARRATAAKLSPILLSPTASFARGTRGPPTSTEENRTKAMTSSGGRRRRSSSVLTWKEPPESPEQLSDQALLPNRNASWVNGKGTQRKRTGRGSLHETPNLFLTIPSRIRDSSLAFPLFNHLPHALRR